MLCPECGSRDVGVKDSRPADGARTIRRRRLCFDCGARFTTWESPINLLHRKRSLIEAAAALAAVLEVVRETLDELRRIEQSEVEVDLPE
jgi:DNA-directed RNA polymerase subunit RPC12/RpoP